MAYKFVNADQLDTDLTAVANAIRTKGNTSEQLVFPSGMVSAISAISTGVELNFEVVGNPQPANPKENTIWLNTDVDITGQYLQAEQPEGMAEGEVWISTGTASQFAFNALKKGGTVMVYPISAKQMQGGTLVDVTAKSWQDGEWVEWFKGVYLLNGTDYCDNVTGGWTSAVYNDQNDVTITNGDGFVKITISADNYAQGYFTTKDKISFSGYKTLYIEYEQTRIASNTWLTVHTQKSGYDEHTAKIKLSAKANTKSIGALDVSAVKVDCYVRVGGEPSTTYGINIYRIWLE